MNRTAKSVVFAASCVFAYAAWTQQTNTFLSGAGVAVWTISALSWLASIIWDEVSP
jgi:hypothetical protein